MKKKVLISGAGPAGLATALLLDGDTFDITLVERSPQFNSMGFSIILWKSGFDVLRAATDRSIDSASPINTMRVLSGDEFAEVHSADISGLAHSIERKELVALLSDVFIEKFGDAKVKFSTQITEISNHGSSAKVSLSDGTSEEYDLVICADGMHSDIRSKYFHSKLSSGPYKIVYQWIKPNSGLHEESIVGFQKDITYLLQTSEDRALLAYYIESNGSLEEQFESSLTSAMREKFGESFTIDTQSRKVFAGENVEVDDWYKDCIVLIGDAAHGHPPTLAMGTSMALEDADLLASVLNSTDDSMEALKKYSKQRHSRIHEVYTAQGVVEKMFFSHSQTKADFSDFILKAGGKFVLEHHIRKLLHYSVSS